ncbi:MAG: hypothetical protein U9O59_08180 [Actinomycetota bacterium]|nr:hypothetical protein [Actinomycetota bacterium]
MRKYFDELIKHDSCSIWLAIAYEVRTSIIDSDEDIFIPELIL